jgi:hypothetical protein
MKQWFLILMACLTIDDVKNSVCHALCRHDGYDTGAYKKKTDACLCANETTFEVMTEKKIYLHRKSAPASTPVPSVQVRTPWLDE